MQNKPLVSLFKLAVPLFRFTPKTKPLKQLYFKYKTVLIPKLKIFFILKIFIIICKYKK